MLKYSRIIKSYERSYFLLGPRGTGKSTFLKEAYPDVLKIDLLDEALYQELLFDPKLFQRLIASQTRDSWIVIDEIQRLPTLLNEVHRAIEGQHLNFVLCGSSARKLRRSGVNLLGGRASQSQVFPFVPIEYQQDFDLERSLRIGDLPIIVADSDPAEALKAYVRLYIKEEIHAEAIVRNLAGFSRFLQIAAVMNAQVLNVSSLARDAGVKRGTIDNYISILEDTLMAFRLPAFESRIRIKERSHPKLYLFDCGVVRALKNQSGPVDIDEKGFLFETFFANYFRAMQAYRELFENFYYWSATDAKAEVDFLLKKGKSLVAIEVKSSSRIRPEYLAGLKALKDLKGLKRRILVYLGDSKQVSDEIEYMPFEDFIEEFESGRLFGTEEKK